MEAKRKWVSPQAIIIIAIILLIFIYIGIDMAKIKPGIRSDLNEVRMEYVVLSDFLDDKIPEIDSTLKLQAEQILDQGSDINSLSEKVKSLAEKE